MDNSLAEVLSFEHIYKRCSGRVDSFVNVFLGLDTAFDEPLQQSDQSSENDWKRLTCGTRSFLSLTYLGPKSGSLTKNPWNRIRLGTMYVMFLMPYRSSVRSA